MKRIRLILGDQLNRDHSWFRASDESTIYFMAEMRQETDYAKHHVQKVIAFFLAMRAFAEELVENGHQVIYYELDEPGNQQDLVKNLLQVAKQANAEIIECQLPDEYRLDQQLNQLKKQFNGSVIYTDTEHFLTERHDLKKHFDGKKSYLMESFYRMMRKKHGVLMDGNEPATGKWNYDASNRKKLPKGHRPPEPKYFDRDVSALLEMIAKEGVETIGEVDQKRFIWPVTPEEGEKMLNFFVEECLPHFGDFQDAMTPEYWSLYHSRLSFLMNAKIMHPMKVIEAAERAWRENPDRISISQAEGFIRQILGWREYMRGVYWAKMPEFGEMNFFQHDRKLPSWFWDGKTNMSCLRHAIKQSLEFAYAHHIQRLMVTGNFMLLVGIDPKEVDDWYLGIYIDAIEWVEITNTRGMSQFADGGIVGTKPYVSSANYLKKMSSYCDQCHYDHQKKTGRGACPFNSLYWNFYDRHRDKLSNNPRIGMMYRTWDKMGGEQKAELLEQAQKYLTEIEEL